MVWADNGAVRSLGHQRIQSGWVPRLGAKALRRLTGLLEDRSTRVWGGYLEALEQKILLNGDPLSHVFSRYSDQLNDPTDTAAITVPVSAGDFTANRLGGVNIGFRVKAQAGSALAPAAVAIRDAGGQEVALRFANADLSDGVSLALAELAFGDYEVTVSGESGTSGAFDLELFLIGDADGDRDVDRDDTVLVRGSFGSLAGEGGYLLEADSDLDGRITSFDVTQHIRNIAASTSLEPVTPTGEIRGMKFLDVEPTDPGDPADGPILLLTPDGELNSVGPVLESAGFEVIVGTLGPGEISAVLSTNPDVDQVWVWNDGSQPLRNSGTPPIDSLFFTDDDLDALAQFQQSHDHWIMDGLSWRGHVTDSERSLTANEAINLAAVGGGIVLGADNGPPTGVSNVITQHVNQVAEFFDFDLFIGAYMTTADIQFEGGDLFDTPNPVDPDQLTSSTTSYSELPHGSQPNGVFLATAVFGSPSSIYPGFSASSPPLEPDTFDGQAFNSVNHIVTTSIPGGGIDVQGLEGWVIYLDENDNAVRDPGELFTTTDTDGNYAFTDLPVGTYIVREEQQPGFEQTVPFDGFYEVVLAADEVVTGIDYGNRQVEDNNPPVIVSDPVTQIELGAPGGDPQLIDLSTWTVVQYELNAQDDANWALDATNTVVEQTINADASIFLSDFDIASTQIEGSWRVDTSGDDDYMGFVFGYQGRGHYYLFDWKQLDQGDALGFAQHGMSVKVIEVDGGGDPTGLDLWPTSPTTGNVTVLRHNTIGWEDFVDYEFQLTFFPGQFQIEVLEGDTVLESWTVDDDTYTGGGFGFYNYSQGNVLYSGFTQRDLPPQQYVYDVEAVDPDGDPLTYSLVTGPSGMGIDPDTGLVTWDVTSTDLGQHDVTVRVDDDGGLFDTQSFTITVEAAGNNPPAVEPQVFTVDENSPNATVIGTVVATDPDAGDTLTFAVTGGTGTDAFAVDEQTGQITVADTGLLDFETTPSLTLDVTVTDGGGLTDTATVTINLNNVNEPPTITSQPVTSLVISSDELADPQIIDLGAWEVVQFATSNQSGNPVWTLSNGNTVARQAINAEASVLLSDAEFENERIEGTFRVDSAADDDFMGFVFGYQDPQNFYLFDWAQGNENNTPRMQVRVVHASVPLTQDVLGPDSEHITTLFSNSIGWEDFTDYRYVLEFEPGSISIDVFEGQTVLESIVLSDTTYLSGRFGFYNFSQEQVLYSGFTRQSVTRSTYQYDAEAEDPDVGDVLTFSLDQSPVGMTIDVDTGLITWDVTATDVGDHDVTVRVEDPGGLFDTQSFTVSVVFQDSDPPVVVAGLLNDTGREDGDGVTFEAAVAGTVTDASEVTGLRASLDGGPLVDVLGSLLSDGSFTLTEVDLETIGGGPLSQGSHTLSVEAEDEFGNVSSPLEVGFELDSVAPEAPSTPDLLAGSDSGASDSDDVTNDETPTVSTTAEAESLVRLLVDGVEADQAVTGGTQAFTPGPLSEGGHTFEATAEDVAGNVSDASGDLVVTVDVTPPLVPTLDLDPGSDTDPVGDLRTTEATVTLVGTTDPDTSVELLETGDTTVSDGAGAFAFAEIALALGGNDFTAEATDVAGNAGSPFAVTITRDSAVSNNPPVVDDQTFVVDEDSAAGTVVGTIAANDPDVGDTLTFTVTGGTGQTAFDVDPGSGEITVANSGQLDFETTASFTLEVEVNDDGTPSLSDTATVTIEVSNVNEPPVVDDQSFTVDEDSADGTVVGTIVASDPDAGDTLTFTVTGGTDQTTFDVDPGSGEITVANSGQLDFETTASFTLEVEVNDDGTPSLSDTATMTIEVSNVNEPPVVAALIADVTVDEDAPDTVVDLSAVFADPDSGSGDSLTLMVEGNDNDTVVGTSLAGTTLTLSYLADQNGVANVTVRATDSGGLFVDDTFVVTVASVNDAPVNAVPGSQTTDEDVPLVLSSGNGNAVSMDDVDAGANEVAVSLAATNGLLTLAGTGGANVQRRRRNRRRGDVVHGRDPRRQGGVGRVDVHAHSGIHRWGSTFDYDRRPGL